MSSAVLFLFLTYCFCYFFNNTNWLIHLVWSSCDVVDLTKLLSCSHVNTAASWWVAVSLCLTALDSILSRLTEKLERLLGNYIYLSVWNLIVPVIIGLSWMGKFNLCPQRICVRRADKCIDLNYSATSPWIIKRWRMLFVLGCNVFAFC